MDGQHVISHDGYASNPAGRGAMNRRSGRTLTRFQVVATRHSVSRWYRHPRQRWEDWSLLQSSSDVQEDNIISTSWPSSNVYPTLLDISESDRNEAIQCCLAASLACFHIPMLPLGKMQNLANIPISATSHWNMRLLGSTPEPNTTAPTV